MIDNQRVLQDRARECDDLNQLAHGDFHKERIVNNTIKANFIK